MEKFDTLKRILTGAALAVLYSVMCYIDRGYWDWRSDLVVTAMAAVCYMCIVSAMRSDAREAERSERQRMRPSAERYERSPGEWLVK